MYNEDMSFWDWAPMKSIKSRILEHNLQISPGILAWEIGIYTQFMLIGRME